MCVVTRVDATAAPRVQASFVSVFFGGERGVWLFADKVRCAL
jgi:hypothetical protein